MNGGARTKWRDRRLILRPRANPKLQINFPAVRSSTPNGRTVVIMSSPVAKMSESGSGYICLACNARVGTVTVVRACGGFGCFERLRLRTVRNSCVLFERWRRTSVSDHVSQFPKR